MERTRRSTVSASISCFIAVVRLGGLRADSKSCAQAAIPCSLRVVSCSMRAFMRQPPEPSTAFHSACNRPPHRLRQSLIKGKKYPRTRRVSDLRATRHLVKSALGTHAACALVRYPLGRGPGALAEGATAELKW